MRKININQRQARMLRENLTANQDGYDYVDLQRLARMAEQLTALQGEYGEQMAVLAREERRIRRGFVKGEISQADGDRMLQALSYDIEDLHEAAANVGVDFIVEDADWKLIQDKVSGLKWQGNDTFRSLVLSMLHAIENAEYEGAGAGNGKVKHFTRREPTPA